MFVAPAKNIEHLAKQDKISTNDTKDALARIIETSTKLNKSDTWLLQTHLQQGSCYAKHCL